MYNFVRLQSKHNGRTLGWYLLIPDGTVFIKWFNVYGNKRSGYALIRLAMSMDENKYDEDFERVKKSFFISKYSHCREKLLIDDFRKLANLANVGNIFDYGSIMVAPTGDLSIFKAENFK